MLHFCRHFPSPGVKCVCLCLYNRRRSRSLYIYGDIVRKKRTSLELCIHLVFVSLTVCQSVCLYIYSFLLREIKDPVMSLCSIIWLFLSSKYFLNILRFGTDFTLNGIEVCTEVRIGIFWWNTRVIGP